MKQLFRKSNLLHLRTNEGDFEVINPEEFEAAWIPLGVTIEQYFKSFEGTDHPEWPGEVEIKCTKNCRTGADCDEIQGCNLVARLIPKEEFKPESAYKEWEDKPVIIIHDVTSVKGGILHSNKEPIESSEPQDNIFDLPKDVVFDLQRIALADDEMSAGFGAGVEYRLIARSILNRHIKTIPAPSESQEEQEELWKEARHYIDVWRIEELFKRFTIRRNGDKD